MNFFKSGGWGGGLELWNSPIRDWSMQLDLREFINAYTVSSWGKGVKEWEAVIGVQPREYTLCQFPLRNMGVILREVCESDIFCTSEAFQLV